MVSPDRATIPLWKAVVPDLPTAAFPHQTHMTLCYGARPGLSTPKWGEARKPAPRALSDSGFRDMLDDVPGMSGGLLSEECRAGVCIHGFKLLGPGRGGVPRRREGGLAADWA